MKPTIIKSYVAAAVAVLSLGSAPAQATLVDWLSEVDNGTADEITYTNITSPTTGNIGSLSGDKTYEFIVNANDVQGSAALIGSRGGGTQNQAIKFEQYNNTMRYGLTAYGSVDALFNTTTTFGQDVHLTFVSSGSNNDLYVNGLYVETLSGFTLDLDGFTGIGQNSDGSDVLGFGEIIGFATYNSALSAAEIESHSTAYYAVPAPLSLSLLGLGLLGLGFKRRQSMA